MKRLVARFSLLANIRLALLPFETQLEFYVPASDDNSESSTLNKFEQEQYRMLQSLHDEAVDAIVTIDERGEILSCNPATEAMFGYAAQELIGHNVNILMPSPYREAHDGYLANYLSSGQAKIIGIGREVIGKRKDGSSFPIHLAVSEIASGGQRRFAGVIRDLTDFKLLEQRETTLGRIIEDSFNEVYLFDASSLHFLQVNRGARNNLGYSMDELRLMAPFDIKPEFDEQAFREKIAPLVGEKVQRLEFETLHQRKDGSTYIVEVYLQMSRYHDQPVFVAIVLDVTRRREAEAALQRQAEAMQAELEELVQSRTQELRMTQEELVRSEKFSTLGKVSGGIAHEIRNPLNAVKTSAYYLLNAKQPTEEKVKEHLERIDRQVTLIDNVVTALSDVAKLPEAKLESVDLDSMLRSAISSVGLPHNVEVRHVVSYTDELQSASSAPDGTPLTPHVMADRNQLMIAIKNLIRNARDAMPDGGSITLAIDVAPDRVRFDVIDTGEGMNQETMDKILEPLFTTKARGMGLGLSITRAIVEKNQGELAIHSELGSGSTFSVTLQRGKQ